jgi:hypothetical protein
MVHKNISKTLILERFRRSYFSDYDLFLETSVVPFHVEEEATVTYTKEEEERRRTEAKRLECEERLKRIRYFNDPLHLPLMVPASAKYIGVNQQSRIVLEIDVPSDDRLQVDICSFSTWPKTFIETSSRFCAFFIRISGSIAECSRR